MNHDPPGEHEPYDPNAMRRNNRVVNRIPSSRFVRIDAHAIADAPMGVTANASLILQRHGNADDAFTVRFAGRTAQLPRQWLDPAIPRLDLSNHLIIPALVNAHTHLDLTHIGPIPHDPGDGFVRWVDQIRAGRAKDDRDIARCVRLGIEKSIAGGVIAVGDIAGAPEGRLTEAPVCALADSPLVGVSYLEFFGMGTSAPAAERRIEAFLTERLPTLQRDLADSGVRFGLQPHAPNTIDLGLYRWVTRAAEARALPLATHLAETPEEREFIAHARGPQRELLERLGLWDDSILHHIGHGRHPIEHLRPVLASGRYLVAHVNDADDQGIATLAETGVSVAYCPRASRYFGAERHFGPHRYREMLDAGVNVCLGTDSIVNLDTPDRISTLDDMRLLYNAGDTNPRRLLAMATTNAATALGLDPKRFTLTPGETPMGILGIDLGADPGTPEHEQHAWDIAMRKNTPPTWLI